MAKKIQQINNNIPAYLIKKPESKLIPITFCESHKSKSLIKIYKEIAKYDNNLVWKIKSKAMVY